MGEAVIDLTPELMTAIGEYVRGPIHEWIGPGFDSAITERDLEQRERIICVEESLRHGFEQSDNRFGQMFAYFTTGFIFLGLMMSVYKSFDIVNFNIQPPPIFLDNSVLLFTPIFP